MKRILLGGTFAGLVVFIFSAIDHMALPTGHMGVKSLPQEDLVLGAMGTAIKEPGLYVFPGMDFSKKPTEEEQKAYIARYNAGPTGILVYSLGGQQPMQPRQLSTELLSDILAAWIAAWVISLTSASFGKRVLIVALLGLFAWLSITVSYWNWYRFPSAYAVAEAIDQVGGWLCGGLVLAAVFRGARERIS
jgi:hypothetical protein